MLTLYKKGQRMVVYIEYVLIDNFCIDYLLLKATFFFTTTTVKKRRLFLCALLGSIIALLFPLINFDLIFTSILKIISGLLLVLLATKYQTLKSFYANFLCFLFLTFALGGAIIGVFSLLNLDYSSETSIAIMILPCYLILKVIIDIIKFSKNNQIEKNFTANCVLYHNNKVLKVSGFFDTGNSLYYNNKPIIVLDKKLFYKLFNTADILKNNTRIEYQTSAGNSKMPLFMLDKLELEYKENKYVIGSIYLGLGVVGNK